MSRSSAAWRPSSAAFKESLQHFAERPFVRAVRESLPAGFVALLGAIVVFLLLQMRGAPVQFGVRLAHAYLPSFGIMAAVFVVVLAFMYAKRAEVSPVPVLLGGLCVFVLALPAYTGDVISYLRLVGPSGLFLAMLAIGIIAAFRAAVPNIWFASALAAAVGVLLFLLHISLASVIAASLAPLARLGDTYVALMVIVLVETLLWVIGIHGPAMLAAVVTPVYLTLQMQNTDAFSHHALLPNIVVVSLFLFIFPGGAGATLPLAVLLAFSRVPRLRRIGRVTVVPALFNTNEPLLFGAPVVFNPYLAIPFIIVPLVLATTTYWSVAFGLVARSAYYVPSSIPTFISTYIATLDVRAVVLVLVNLAIAAIIYYPFVRAYEAHLVLRQAQDDRGVA